MPPLDTFIHQPRPSLKGRGTIWALAHRFAGDQRQAEDDGWAGLEPTEAMPPPRTQVFEERVKTILARNDSPDVGFELSVNPYRGCEHGCIYCFARPTHSYLNLSPGLDFETRLVAKVNAAERLAAAFASPSYRPASLNLGSATDAWQPIERRLRITRGVLEVLSAHRHAFTTITKSAGIVRDIDLLAPLAAQGLAAVCISVTTLDAQLARTLEPRAATPARRLQAMRQLADAGIPVAVSVSPLIPFLNEPELERILAAARDAGARSAFGIVLRLPWEVKPLFLDWLQRHHPERAERVMARVREMRGGADYDARFGLRMRGQGVWADLLAQRFQKACARLGLNQAPRLLKLEAFQRPPPTAPAPGRAAGRRSAAAVAAAAATAGANAGANAGAAAAAPSQGELF